MVKVAWPVLPLASVMATMCVPELAVGTMNVALVKDPEGSDRWVPLRVSGALSHVAMMSEFGAKLKPDTWIVLPVFPLAGLRMMEGSTTKMTEAEVIDSSVIVKRWSPAVVVGTVNVTPGRIFPV